MSDTLVLVVFDWAGTTTDYGSQAPVHVFDRTFKARGLSFDRADINAPMGMEKRAHIRTMLSTEKGSALWQQAQGRAWTEADVDALYESFEETLRQVVAEYSHPIPGVPETVEELRKMGLKVGSTTGYTSEIMSLVAPVAAREGYAPDCIITPDQTDGLGRPTPFMLFACMQRLRVWPVSRVVKVGDTISDISEGKSAGAWAIGILTGSNLVGLDQDEAATLPAEQVEARKAAARKAYLEAGADLVIDSIRELPDAIRVINARLAAEAAQ